MTKPTHTRYIDQDKVAGMAYEYERLKEYENWGR